MFDSGLPELPEFDAKLVSRLVAEQHRTRVRAECAVLELACHWADLHSPVQPRPVHPSPVQPSPKQAGPAGKGREGVRLPGGDGTPMVQEFAAAEFGAQIETTTNAAWELIGDALDLRHRLPRLWVAVRDGRVRVWKARRVAHDTRWLSLAGARQVDAALDGIITAVSWARFETILAAKIAEADPSGDRARAAAYDAERFVRAGRATENGLKLLVARAAAGDVALFLAIVDRLADILAIDGDTDLVDVRRSKAIGILARPDRALDLLRRHVQTIPPAHPDPFDDDRPDDDRPDDDRPDDDRPDDDRPDDDRPDDDRPDDDRPDDDRPDDDRPEAWPAAAGGSVARDESPEPGCGTDAVHGGDSPCEPEPDPEGDRHLSVGLGGNLPVDRTVSRPAVDLVIHLAAETLGLAGGPCRMEGVGILLLDQVRRWLNDTGCTIRLRPVVDLNADVTPSDAYEIPRTMRRIIGLRIPASVFPYSNATHRSQKQTGRGTTGSGQTGSGQTGSGQTGSGRTGSGQTGSGRTGSGHTGSGSLDLDHTVPYLPPDRGGPPGQTRIDNLGPLSRSEHRLKTHSSWQVRQPEAGVYVWRSPTGNHWLVTPHAGTYPLGAGSLATSIWRAVKNGRYNLAA